VEVVRHELIEEPEGPLTGAEQRLRLARATSDVLLVLDRALGGLATGSAEAARPAAPHLRQLGHRMLRILGQLALAGLALTALGVGVVTLGPRVLPFQTLIVISGSMEPVLPVGSVAILEHVSADQLAPGDVIAFRRPDRPDVVVTHRIVALDESSAGRGFITKGDANGIEDPWLVPAQGTGLRAVGAIPLLGYLLTALASAPGRIALIVLPLAGLALSVVRRIWLPAPLVRSQRVASHT
jgi:signal peptidase